MKYILLVFAIVPGSLTASSLLDKERAAYAYRVGEYDAAYDAYERLLVDYDTDPDVVYGFGKSAFAKEEFEKAEAAFARATSLDSLSNDQRIQALFDQGNAQVKLDTLLEAKASYQQVLEYDSEHAQAQEMIEKIERELARREQENEDNQQEDPADSDSNSQDQEGEDGASGDDQDGTDDQNGNNQESRQSSSDEESSSEQQNNQGSPADDEHPDQEPNPDGNNQSDQSSSGDQSSQDETGNDTPEQSETDGSSGADGSGTDYSDSASETQDGQDGDAEDDQFGETEGKDQGKQDRDQPGGKEQNNQSSGQSDESDDQKSDARQSEQAAGDNQQVHDDPSLQMGGADSADSTTSPETAQEPVFISLDEVADETPLDEYENRLVTLLETQEADALKQLLNEQIKTTKSAQYGKNNW